MLENIICPVCEQFLIEEEYDMCEICGWFLIESDYNDHNYNSGLNHCSLNEYKRQRQAGEIPKFPHFGYDGEELTDEEFKRTLKLVTVNGKTVYKQVFDEE